MLHLKVNYFLIEYNGLMEGGPIQFDRIRSESLFMPSKYTKVRFFSSTVFTLSIGTHYLLTKLVLKFKIVNSTSR